MDPRTGRVRADVRAESDRAEVDRLCRAAAACATELRQRPRTWRAELLRGLADALEQQRPALVEIADAETALGPDRLNGELTRTCFQLRLFADVVAEGGYLEAIIDHAGQTPMGPRPDLRRMLVPTGPVAVFGASNFPFAFSVPGGDTASALAAGCPVVVKAHESHPATSQLCGEILIAAARELGAPDGTLSLVFGRDAGAQLVQHPVITAVAFTGSLPGGRALMELIGNRPDPVPFYGELASINPVVVTAAAAAERGQQIGSGIAASAMLGGGQFCTKPGLVLVPAGGPGDEVVKAAADGVAAEPPRILLNDGIARAFTARTSELLAMDKLRVLAEGTGSADVGFAVVPRLLETDAQDLEPALLEECFGPLTLLVRYRSQEELTAVLADLPSSLTATVHLAEDDNEVEVARLVALLEEKAGRILFNGFPTGVAVAWAMHHGGGWPSTNSLHTSVGPTAIRRFLKPISWQSAPESLLPEELRDATTGLPRRIDGVLLAG